MASIALVWRRVSSAAAFSSRGTLGCAALCCMVPASRSPLLPERLDDVHEELPLLDRVLDRDMAVPLTGEPACGHVPLRSICVPASDELHRERLQVDAAPPERVSAREGVQVPTLRRVVLGRRFLENTIMVYDGMRAQVTFASSPDQEGSSSRPEPRPVLLRDNHETQGFGASVIVARRTRLGPLIYSIPMKAVRVSVAHRRRDV